MKTKLKPRILIPVIVFHLLALASCVPIEKMQYFNDIDKLQEPSANPKLEKLIMPFDRLYIKVFSIDEKTNQLFNSNENVPVSSSASIIGYLVDKNGFINYPFTGKINVKGLTLEEAATKLGKALNEYVSNAAIVIKYIENNVTLAGEVQRQGVYTFSQERLNIYEALALGGGITQYGNRKKVVLIRQEGDNVVQHKLDLSDSRITGNEFYFVQANDVIIVEPLRSSSWYKFNSQTYSTILTTLTFLLSIFTFSIIYKHL